MQLQKFSFFVIFCCNKIKLNFNFAFALYKACHFFSIKYYIFSLLQNNFYDTHNKQFIFSESLIVTNISESGQKTVIFTNFLDSDKKLFCLKQKQLDFIIKFGQFENQ